MEPQNSNKKLVWFVIIVIILVLGYFMLMPQGNQVSDEALSSDAVASEVEKDLNSVDLGNLDEDIKVLDNDINRL